MLKQEATSLAFQGSSSSISTNEYFIGSNLNLRLQGNE